MGMHKFFFLSIHKAAVIAIGSINDAKLILVNRFNHFILSCRNSGHDSFVPIIDYRNRL